MLRSWKALPPLHPTWARSLLSRQSLLDRPTFLLFFKWWSLKTYVPSMTRKAYTSVLVQNTISLHDRLEKTSLFLCFRFHVFNQTHVCTLLFLRGVSLWVTNKELKGHFMEWYCSFPRKLISFLCHLVLVLPNVFAPFLKCSGPHGHCSISSWGQMEPIQFIYLFVSSNLQWKSQGS